jgi:hypothetical protein
MNTKKRKKYFQAGFLLIICLLLWIIFPASSFSQNGGGSETGKGDKGSDITKLTVSGKVVQTMDSGGYTYALVDKDDAMTWVALPKSKIAVGNEITCQPGMVMNNFTSTSLKQTFKQIVFSSGITSFSEGTALPATTIAPDETPVVPKIKKPDDWKDF